MFSVLIVDNHFLVREGLKQLIGQEYRSVRFGEAGTVSHAVTMLAKRPWDLMLLAIGLPDGDGFTVLEKARQLRPATRVLIVTRHSDHLYAARSHRMGAAGYVCKTAERSELLEAIEAVVAGQEYFRLPVPKIAAAADSPVLRLSQQEFTVMLAIARGRRNSQIAEDSNLSKKTISTYKRRVLTKLGLKSTADLVRFVIDAGLV